VSTPADDSPVFLTSQGHAGYRRPRMDGRRTQFARVAMKLEGRKSLDHTQRGRACCRWHIHITLPPSWPPWRLVIVINRQLTEWRGASRRGVVVAEQDIGDGLAAALAGFQASTRAVSVRRSIGVGERRPLDQDHDSGRAGLEDGLERSSCTPDKSRLATSWAFAVGGAVVLSLADDHDGHVGRLSRTPYRLGEPRSCRRR